MPATETKAMPPAIALAMQTLRPSLLRELVGEASDELRALDDDQKVYVLQRMIRSVITMLEKSDAEKKVAIYEDIVRSLRNNHDDNEACFEELGERLKKVESE